MIKGDDEQPNKLERTIQNFSQTLSLFLGEFKLLYQEQLLLLRSLKTGFSGSLGRDLMAPTLIPGSLPPTPVHCSRLMSGAVPLAVYWWAGVPKANPELRSCRGSGPGGIKEIRLSFPL